MVLVYNPLSSDRRGSDGKGKLNDDGEVPHFFPKGHGSMTTKPRCSKAETNIVCNEQLEVQEF